MIHFTPDETDLLLSSLQNEKELKSKLGNSTGSIEQIEEEIQRQNIFLSRSQLSEAAATLTLLLRHREKFDMGEVLNLQNKIEAWTKLP